MSSETSTPIPTKRRPYHGSCHCGHIRYIVFLTLPPSPLTDPATQTPSQRIYKCNCTACHKTGFFHLRLSDSPHDFLLLSPTDSAGMSDYVCQKGELHWHFCPNCGVRCFIFSGASEVVDIDLEKELGEESQGKMTKVWKAKGEGWSEGRQGKRTGYLSVNALTVEAGQEGFDLREWVDKKLVMYLDCLNYTDQHRPDYPHIGGTW